MDTKMRVCVYSNSLEFFILYSSCCLCFLSFMFTMLVLYRDKERVKYIIEMNRAERELLLYKCNNNFVDNNILDDNSIFDSEEDKVLSNKRKRSEVESEGSSSLDILSDPCDEKVILNKLD